VPSTKPYVFRLTGKLIRDTLMPFCTIFLAKAETLLQQKSP